MRSNWIKHGAIVIDVGINFVEVFNPDIGKTESILTGDVQFNEECL